MTAFVISNSDCYLLLTCPWVRLNQPKGDLKLSISVYLLQFLRPSRLLASGGVRSLGIIQLSGLKGKDTLSLNQSRQTWDMRSLSFLWLAVSSVPFLFSSLFSYQSIIPTSKVPKYIRLLLQPPQSRQQHLALCYRISILAVLGRHLQGP